MTLDALTPTRVATTTEVLKLLDEAVTEYGENHTASCMYAKTQSDGSVEPVCIAGVVLSKLGVPPESLKNLSTIFLPNDSRGMGRGPVEIARDEYGIEFTPAAGRVLRQAQAMQDTAIVWGLAVESARAFAVELGEE